LIDSFCVIDIRDQQHLLRRNTKVRRLLRLHHLLGNEQQLQKWQRFISPSSRFSFGTQNALEYLAAGLHPNPLKSLNI